LLNSVLRNSRILIIEDQEDNVVLLQRVLLRAGFAQYRSITESSEAITAFDEYRPDLVLLDLHMPGQDGFEVLRRLRLQIPEQTYLPIAILTAELSQAARDKALLLGARDFITRPYDNTEIELRIETLLGPRFQNREFEQFNRLLDQKVHERTKDLENGQIEILHRLALIAERHYDTTGSHTLRVGHLAGLLAQAIHLPEQHVRLIKLAAPLHDLGKIGMPDKILLKPEKLTLEEYDRIKTHTVIGAHILSRSDLPILQLAEKIAMYHHERWDGTGYWGLCGEAIPVEARIVSIADTYDVMTHPRPYKKAGTPAAAIAEITAQSGRQFDPRLVSEFTDLLFKSGMWALSRAVEFSHPEPSRIEERQARIAGSNAPSPPRYRLPQPSETL
jgi:putative two-component system response regulator